jgi:DNA polymerase I-like protein with 3'-5' exonuclease and polymerase domains
MDIVTIDTETYWDKDFSLSKMTTEAYIRDPRFEVIGVSVKLNDQEVDWYSGADPGGFLNAIDYSDKAILCHNTAFDGAILSWKYGIRPKLWLDTLSMARPLHSMTVGGSLKALATYYELGDKGDEVMRTQGLRRRDFTPEQMSAFAEYCVQDTNLTYRLFKKMVRRFPKEELLVIDQTIRMYTEPKFELDPVVLDAHLAAIHERKQKLLEKLGGEEKAKKYLMSNAKFASLLQALGAEPPMKTSPTTGKQTYAFAKNDTEFLALLDHPKAAVRTVVEARLGTKSTIEETRTQRFLEIAERGPLPIMLNYYGAHTGRFSGGDKINLQNLPRGGALRKALAAPDGHVVVACDSSQIEARLVAYLAGQDDLVQSFREGRDVYSEFASDVYQRPITKADKVERHVGKTCVAEGTLILTERGQVPVEEITVEDRVWDGVEWVNHEGVVYQGEKEVIHYDGLYATADHGVLTDQGPLPFGVAASRLATLLTSGDGGEAVRVGEDYLPADTTPEEAHLLVRRMYDLWCAEVDQRRQPESEQVQGLPVVFTDQVEALCRAWAEIRRHIGTLHEPFTQALSQLWWPWHPATVQVAHGVHSLGRGTPSAPRLQGRGDRSGRQQWALRPRKSPAGYSPGAGQQQTQYGQGLLAGAGDTSLGVPFPIHAIMDIQAGCEERANRRTGVGKVRVYDILNAGPRRRYTAANKLIFNCILGLGYGMGPPKFLHSLATGFISVTVDEGEAQQIVRLYRNKYHRIQAFWNRCNHELNGMVAGASGELCDLVSYDSEGIILPNGMRIRYPALRRTANGFEYINDARVYRKFVRARVAGEETPDLTWTKLYGGKVVENLTQAVARIVVSEQMVRIGRRYPVALQVHDEIVCVVPEEQADACKQYMIDVMSTPPKWAPDLPVACEADVGPNYGEAK